MFAALDIFYCKCVTFPIVIAISVREPKKHFAGICSVVKIIQKQSKLCQLY